MDMDKLLLALDFGGTKHTAATLSPGGRTWHAHRRVFAPPGADARYDIETMFTLARELLGGNQPAAIGVSFGGPVDHTTGVVRLSHHVPGWEAAPLQQMLEAEFGAPARVDNDANAAALGEHRYGAGQGCASLLYVTVSTGVGGGWILDGQLWRGHEGMAGEIGHTVVDPQGPLCLCGKRGCVERFASGPYLAQRARRLLRDHPLRGDTLRRLSGGDLEAVDAALVARAADAGDEVAREVLGKAAWALGVSIGNAANLINPQRVILGGGVTKSGDLFWDAVRLAAHRTALPEVHFGILPAALGDDAPLWGAAALAASCLK